VRIHGRLTGHFLKRVALLIGALGTVFIVWGVILLANSGHLSVREYTPLQLLEQAEAGATLTPEGDLALSAETSATVLNGAHWLQVLDEDGTVISSIKAAETLPDHYTPGELVLYRQSPERIGQVALHTWMATIDGRSFTFVLGQSEDTVTRRLGRYALTSDGASLVDLTVLIVAGMVVVFGVAAVFARTLSKPMNHMMRWLSALAGGDYTEPVDRKGRPISRTRNGRSRRKPYRTYREVFDSLDMLTDELRRARAALPLLASAREEWIAGITHDLRTPLTSVRGYADVLASDYDFDAAEVRRQAAIIAEQAEHLQELIDDLMLTFRLNAEALPLSRARVDLIELVRDAAVDLANDPRSHGREVVFEEPPGVGAMDVDVDPMLFRRAVSNLLTNAVVHNPDGTTVRIHVTRDSGSASVSIADDGTGMDAATLDRLFDRYYRGTSTESLSDGTGLGMAIARQIVEAYGGSIEATSAVGTGTTVTLRIPAP